jgi:hypothetical protein
VRRCDAGGKEREQVLASYQAMRDPDNNAAKVVTTLQAGMSTRSQDWANEGAYVSGHFKTGQLWSLQNQPL